MTYDAKDRAITAASLLIGYCMSATNLPIRSFPEDDFDITKHWILGLLDAAKLAGTAIDAAIDQEGKEGE